MSSKTEQAGNIRRTRVFEIKPLRYVDLPKATQHSNDAFREESQHRYIADADSMPFHEQREYLGKFAILTDSVRLLDSFCINGGESLLLIGGPGRTRGPVSTIVLPLLGAIGSAEYKKRRAAIVEKVRALLKAAFGDSMQDMLEIHWLATAPECQGRGYASALMQAANDMADAQGRGVYAITTDAYRFYEAHGYTVLSEGFVGGDNPKWHGDPVGIRIVYRAPRVPAEKEL